MSRGSPKRAVSEPCERREEILDVATRQFADRGFAGADTQLLADELGVGKGTIYRYFESKRALFLAAVDRAMRQLHERIEESTRGAEDPLTMLDLAFRAYLDFFDEHPELVELLIQERASFKDRARPTYFVHRERTVERWRERYRDLIARGRLREMPVERISDVIAAMLYGAMFLNYFGGRTESFAATADDLLDVLLFGILSDPERAAAGAVGPGLGPESDLEGPDPRR
jgi:AcrR family transcriptional regulator